MKTRVSFQAATSLQTLAVAVALWSPTLPAQLPPTDPSVPVVTLTAPDPAANEAGDPGVFRLFRHGPTNLALNVYWHVGGSATPDMDYLGLPGIVGIPAGVREVIVPVGPKDDGDPEPPETIEARLFYPPIEAPQLYLIGFPNNAVVTLFDNDSTTSNHPPFVRIVMPTNDSVFPYPTTIQIVAAAEDPDLGDYVDTVEFFAGTNSLGIRTNCLLCTGPLNPFMLPANLPPGEHILTAKATDSRGASTHSAPVRVVLRVPPLPVVTIQATDPHSSEPGVLTVIDPGVFTVNRIGETNLDLLVHYSIRGTASNGVDYAFLSNSVVIPAGRHSAPVTLMPLHDNLIEGTETVVLRLEDVLCPAIFPPPPGCYQVGTPREAVVYIADANRPTNLPPAVRITKPLDGQTFLLPANVPIRVETVDPDGYVDLVEVYAGTNQIGAEQRLYLLPPPPGQPAVFEFVWTNPPPGRHVLTARAHDDQGAFGLSLPVCIWVVLTNPPPVTNLPPLVTISSPDPIASEGTNCCRWLGWTNSTPTNYCGTNTATFVVRRAGPTNDALTVYYRIGGIASNGVDYLALPGVVTIPAGRRAAEFKLVPLDDLLPEPLETVVLGLRAPPGLLSNVPPYLIGFPSRAAAVIVDNDAPRPTTGHLADRCFHVMKPGANGTWWRIEVSRDLIHWAVLGTNVVTDGALHFVDPDADEETVGYYRTVPSEPPTD